MSRKSLLGIDLTEWNSLSGLSDPYSLELAKISAEAGVPSFSQLSESAHPDDDPSRDPNHNKGGAPGNRKRKTRLANLRSGDDVLATKGPQDAMRKYLRKKGKLASEDVSFDDCLDAYLEDHGSSLDEFNMLLNLAIENDDLEMQDELFAVEDNLDAILEAGAIQGIKNAFKKGADNLAARAEKGRQAGFAASQKSNSATAPAGAAPKAPAGAPTPAAAAAPPPAATPSDAGTAAGTPAPAPTPGAPAPGPNAGATASGAPPDNTDQTAPTQPGQTTKAADPNKPKKDHLNPGGMSTGQKLAQGSANLAVNAPTQLAKGLIGKIKKAGSAMKKGYKGEDISYWEEFLGENDLTIDEYMSVVEQAYEYGDTEMIEEVHQLDEIFAAWQAKRQAKSDDHAAKMKGKWKAATDVIKTHGKEAVKAASVRGVDLPKKKASTNETMDWMLQMSGYTDEYMEGRTKTQQYHGMKMQAADPDQRKRYADDYKSDASKLANKSAKQDKGKSRQVSGYKKLRSLSPDHNPGAGDHVADERKYLKSKNRDKLAAKAALSPRERRGDIRRKARGHR